MYKSSQKKFGFGLRVILKNELKKILYIYMIWIVDKADNVDR